MALAATMSTSSCVALANPFVRSILIRLGEIVSEAIIVRLTEEVLDRWFFDKTLMDKAAEGVNGFYAQVKPFPDNMRQGRIPVKGSMEFEAGSIAAAPGELGPIVCRRRLAVRTLTPKPRATSA